MSCYLIATGGRHATRQHNAGSNPKIHGGGYDLPECDGHRSRTHAEGVRDGQNQVTESTHIPQEIVVGAGEAIAVEQNFTLHHFFHKLHLIKAPKASGGGGQGQRVHI